MCELEDAITVHNPTVWILIDHGRLVVDNHNVTEVSSALTGQRITESDFLVSDLSNPVGDGRLGGRVLGLARPTPETVIPKCTVVFDIACLNEAPVLLFASPHSLDAWRPTRAWCGLLCAAEASHEDNQQDGERRMIQPVPSSHVALSVKNVSRCLPWNRLLRDCGTAIAIREPEKEG